MKDRRRIRFRTLPLLIIGFLAASLSAIPSVAAGALVGTVYPQPWPAADFSLTDQNGSPFRMADTRGRVVVLSFIYTHCTDFCPFVALKLKEARALLGPAADEAVFVAVTTDPSRDTPKVIDAYSRAIGMEKGWRFVTGTLSAMRKVWKDYFIGVEVEKDSAGSMAGQAPGKPDPQADEIAQAVARGLSREDRGLAGAIIERFGGGYDVSHDIPFWIVDKRGMMRVSLDADATPADIARDIRTLSQE